MIPVRRIYNPDALPREFNSRNRWSHISRVHDQGWCGASWAISTADVASDRFSIMSKGTENVTLSAQHLLSCNNNRKQQGCRGGYLDRAWFFIRRFGYFSTIRDSLKSVKYNVIILIFCRIFDIFLIRACFLIKLLQKSKNSCL